MIGWRRKRKDFKHRGTRRQDYPPSFRSSLALIAGERVATVSEKFSQLDTAVDDNGRIPGGPNNADPEGDFSPCESYSDACIRSARRLGACRS